MKKLILTILAALALSGCATYKFRHGQPPEDKGYVVLRDDFEIPEYTAGQGNALPDRLLAKQRFERRRNIVEDYYKRMGEINNHFKQALWDPLRMMGKLVAGIFRLPFIAVSDYRYEHDPVYKEKIQKIVAEEEAQEQARIAQLKEELGQYLREDLSKEESGGFTKKAPPVKKVPVAKPIKKVAKKETVKPKKEVPAKEVAKKPAPKKEPSKKEPVKKEVSQAPVKALPKQESVSSGLYSVEKTQAQDKAIAQEVILSTQEKKQVVEPKKEKKRAIVPAKEHETSLQAIISARPTQGLSPLKVYFDANKSRVKGARIVSYSWDFGDGDSSEKINPVNTYYSGQVEPKIFKATLIIRDNQGNTDIDNIDIEVLNK